MEVVLACSFPRDERLGSSRVPLRLAEELARQGVRVTLLFAEDLLRLPSGAGSPRAEQLTAPFRIAAALARRGRGADLVDIAGLDAWMYARLARRLRPRQAIVSRSNGLWDRALAVMGELPQPQRPWRRSLGRVYQSQIMCRWERASIVASDMVLFGARADGDEVVRRGWKAPEEVAVVAPGVDDFFASPVPLHERRDVAFVGTLFHRKGSDIAAAAMSRVMAARPTLGFTLFGPGLPATDVLARFTEPVRARVTVVDSLPSHELARRLGHFAVLLFPTRYEGFGLVVLEAMRAGLAVVTTPTGVGVDVVRDGENGLLVPFEDAGATATAVARALDDRDLRVRLARAAVDEAARRTWSRTAAELCAAYERAVARAGRRAAGT